MSRRDTPGHKHTFSLEHPVMEEFLIRPVGPDDHAWICGLLRERWKSTRIVTRGKVYGADTLPGFIAEREGSRRGLVTFRIDGTECEVITLDSLEEGKGIGSALIDVMRKHAARAGCRRLWLVTTNDNAKAIAFYRQRGFRISAVHKNALEESRRLKPEIPLVGIGGVPLRDEIELELTLRASG